VSPLERRYRRLLRAYPASYRSDRGDEMLGTLLDSAAPGQRRPSAREMAALIVGGIRARAARNAGLPALASLRLAAMLACATFINVLFALLANPYLMQFSTKNEWGTYAGLFAATTLIWFVRRQLAVLALLTALAAFCSLKMHFSLLGWVVLCLAVLTALGTERPPKAWLTWSCLPVAYWLARQLPQLVAGLRLASNVLDVRLAFLLMALFVLVPLVWTVTDARPAFALAILLGSLSLALSRQIDAGAWPLAYLAGSVVAALPLLVRIVRRRRRLVV
jgi:hypothetical protein